MFSSYIVVNFLLGAVAIGMLLPLRSPNLRFRQVVLGLCLGVLVGIAAINAVTFSLRAGRDSNVRSVVKYALSHADPTRRQLLIVGSSYTALGVDGPLIERELDAKGYGLQVLDLAKVGNFMISQNYTIDYYLAHAKKVPEFVFLEIGPEYYNDTGAMGDSYVYTGTAIADHAPDQILWRARSIAAYGGSAGAKFNDYWNLATHTLFHAFDFGLSGQLIAEKDVPATPGFIPMDSSRHPVSQTDIAPLMTPANLLSDNESALPANVHFIVAFREMQIKKLKARGVKVVGFYQTELTPVGIRDFGMQVCHELPNVPCIIADDPALQRKLDRPSMWYDSVHLMRPGAEIYSSWVSEQLARALAPYRAAE